MTVVRSTTEPVGRRIRTTPFKRMLDAWRGTMESESEVGPGVHILEADAGFSQRQAEAMHNWALAHGLESELTYHRQPDGWELRVRPAGNKEPPFLQEQVARREAERG